MKRLKRTLKYQDEWLKLYQDEVEFSPGNTGTYAWLHRQPGSFAVVVDSARQLYLLEQFRYPLGSTQWGLPGGGINPLESPEQAAVRETREELGVDIQILKKLGCFYPLSSCSQEQVHIFIAKITTGQPSLKGDAKELFTRIKICTISQALDMIHSGQITDPILGLALFLTHQYLPTFP